MRAKVTLTKTFWYENKCEMTIWTPGSNTRVMKENKAIVQEI